MAKFFGREESTLCEGGAATGARVENERRAATGSRPAREGHPFALIHRYTIDPIFFGLDVFEFEPAVTPGLRDTDRVVLMPHAGSATLETRREMARMVVEDVRRVLSGEKPLRAVPPEGSTRERARVE